MASSTVLRAHLLDFPYEILEHIIYFIDCQKSLYSLCQTNRQLFYYAIDPLYKLNSEQTAYSDNKEQGWRGKCRQHVEDEDYTSNSDEDEEEFEDEFESKLLIKHNLWLNGSDSSGPAGDTPCTDDESEEPDDDSPSADADAEDNNDADDEDEEGDDVDEEEEDDDEDDEDDEDEEEDEDEDEEEETVTPHFFSVDNDYGDPKSAPVWAIVNNRLETLQRAEASGLDIKQFRLLHRAVFEGNLPLFMWLMHQDGENFARYGYRLFIACCKLDEIAIMEALMYKGIQIPTEEPSECVLAACVNDNFHCFQLLNNIGIVDSLCERSLGVCLLEGIKGGMDRSIAVALLEKDADIEICARDGSYAFDYALKAGDIELLDLFIEKGMDVNLAPARAWLPVVIRRGQSEVAVWLINQDIMLETRDGSGNTALEIAIEKRMQEVAMALIRRGAELDEPSDEDGNPPLIGAVCARDEALVTLMLEYGANADITTSAGNSALYFACMYEMNDAIRSLIKYGANIQRSGENSRAIIHMVVEKHLDESFKTLVNHVELDINQATAYRHETPLLLAAWQEYEPILQAVISTPSVDVNKRDALGRTPLFFAAASGNMANVKVLLAAGAQVWAVDAYFATPLFVAVRRGHIDVVKHLLSIYPQGIDDTDIFGNTLVNWAVDYGPAELTELVNRNKAGERILDTVPAKYPQRIGEMDLGYCDVCMRSLKEKGFGRKLRCIECLDADFYVCDWCEGKLKAIDMPLCLGQEHEYSELQ